MWTPKRVLLLLLGLALFTTAYGVYFYFLGRVDGLPELPEAMGPRPGEEIIIEQQPPSAADRKLRLAFGEDCPELRRTIKLEVRSRGMVLAADQFTIVSGGPRDGQVELKPFSVAIFGKAQGGGQFPEINTIRSDVAYLTFDQPITTAAEMGSHKVVGGELVCQVNDSGAEPVRSGAVGGVRIVNNHRTPQRDDDMTLFTPGPVYYQESLHKIWTQEAVVLIDEQSKPKPTRINAIGMDVYLLTEEEEGQRPGGKKGDRAAPPKATAAAPHKPKNTSNISGVKGVLLRSNVDMYLSVEENSSFLGAPKAGAAKPKPGERVAAGPPAPDGKDKKMPVPAAGPATAKAGAAPPAPKDPVHIHTQGPFYYDALAETARFDVSQHPGPNPNRVEVTRKHELNGAVDQLDCSHLLLQMVRKEPAAQPGAAPAAHDDDRTSDLEIETAHAWGDEVTLTSDSEGLTAIGNDLVYNTRTRESTLKGTTEMIAMKDGNEIVARELVILGAAGEKEGQQARALGPGVVKMLNKEKGKRTQQAHFRDEMLVTKEGRYDVLTLTGEASFEDLEHDQRLNGERIKVWLEPGEQKEPPPAGKSADDTPTQHRRPHHVEAVGRVSAWSPGEMNVHDTDRLVVFFEDAPKPAPAPGTTAAAPDTKTVVTEKPAATTTSTAPAAAKPQAGPQERPRQPIDLRARYIEAHIRRLPDKNELDRLWCEGDVRARQDPAGPDEEGSDIRGETMQLLHYPEGHVLTVTGDLAEVKLQKLNIIGPEVNIDQKENKAWVNGLGSMRMPSDTSMTSGEKLARPSELTVYWNRDMFFNGKFALFHGGVQAEQENGRLACQTMQVFLDRYVSLRQGEKKDGPPAKVQKLVCDKSVRVEDRKVDEKTGQMTGYQRIVSPVLSVDNEDNIVIAPGPGEVRLLSLGDKDEAGPGGTSSPSRKPSAADQEMKLTRVTYLGRMFANNATRTAIFYDEVVVMHVPSDNPNLVIDPDKLPPGGLYLKCDQMKVFTRKDAAGKGHQEMEAHGKAVVQSQGFWGRADVIKYDESKELVIFESNEGMLARLYKLDSPGAPPQEITGKKIYYWRKTGDFRVEQGVGITAPNVNTAPRPAPKADERR